MGSEFKFEELFPDAHIIDLGAIVGDDVLCDLCGEDYSNNDISGGILVQSKAICPKCAAPYEEGLKRYGEERLLTQRCPADKSFARWVREDLR